jgi:hypothetical protein
MNLIVPNNITQEMYMSRHANQTQHQAKKIPPHHKQIKKASQAKNKTATITTVVSQQER